MKFYSQQLYSGEKYNMLELSKTSNKTCQKGSWYMI